MKKHARMQALARQYVGQGVDPRYAGYFSLFNEQKFYEAHDILEDLWLADKHGTDGDFYKGLIQLAGAFVHLQKGRPGPAAAVFKLAQNNLAKYPDRHGLLDNESLQRLISIWLDHLRGESLEASQLHRLPPPQIRLLPVRS
jgi:predicted metal-dependent hydrolase